jgi:brefeldin A-resistance guanine nucleotide exchange factor 1
MLQVEDFLSGTTSIPLKPKTPSPSIQQPQRTDDSLLSTLSFYLLYPHPYDETYRKDPTEKEIESTLCALDCIATCCLEELSTEIR